MHRRLPLILFVLTAGLVSGIAFSSAEPGVLNPNQVSFSAAVTNNDVKTVTITNPGATDITVDPAGVSLDASGDSSLFSLNNDQCGSVVLTAGEGTSCSVEVTFSPNATGSFSALLDVPSDSPTSP